MTQTDATTRLPRAAGSVRRSLLAREPGWQFSLMLALDIIVLFIAIPALGAGDADRSVVVLLQFILAVVAIGLLAKSAWLRLILAASFALPLLARLLPGLLPQATTLTMVFAYNLLVTAAMARAVFGPGEVNHHRIAGAIFIYLNLGLLFAVAYAGLQLAVPGAFSGLSEHASHHASNLLHYSFSTMTAIGNSGITPQSPFAASLADLQTIAGQLFPAILLSRLVGLHVSRSR
ncbi:hypothetical protein [Lichenicoccus sp.]|uniref:hypothetical protein n=1 Tax=Lichenicoccus sp. TaxID=2781899 RepID=UPI003D0F8778